MCSIGLFEHHYIHLHSSSIVLQVELHGVQLRLMSFHQDCTSTDEFNARLAHWVNHNKKCFYSSMVRAENLN